MGNTCQEEKRAEMKQKEFELQEFKMLHEDKNQCSDRYCLSATWFRDWEAWVCNKAREPPGPINNKGLVVQRAQGPSLRPNMDHFKFSGISGHCSWLSMGVGLRWCCLLRVGSG